MDNKSLSTKLKKIFDIFLEEIEKNEEFAEKIKAVINETDTTKKTTTRSRRRDPAVINPITMYSVNPNGLLEKLNILTDKELKDIIAYYGMDPSKSAMKWKDRTRLINLIMEASRRRATKGDAFRETK